MVGVAYPYYTRTLYTTYMNTQMLDLLSGQSVGKLSSSLNDIVMYVTIGSITITIIVLTLWIIGHIHRRQVQNATIEIRDILREMNERDKLRQTSRLLAAPPSTIADNDLTESHATPTEATPAQ